MSDFKFNEAERGHIHGSIPREGELYDWQVDNVIDRIEQIINERDRWIRRMDFKDITIEQAKRIAAINFQHINFDDPAIDFSVKYQPYNNDWYEDARELVIIRFQCSGFGAFTYPVEIHIDSMLNNYIYYQNAGLHTLGALRPFPYVKLMTELGILPREESIPSPPKTEK